MHPLLQCLSGFVPKSVCHGDSSPGRGWQPPRTRGGWRDNSDPRPLLLSTCSGIQLSTSYRTSTSASDHRGPCSSGSSAASPILYPQDHPLVGPCSWMIDRVLALGTFRLPPTFRPSATAWATDRELPAADFHAPERERSSLSHHILREGRFAGKSRRPTPRLSSTSSRSVQPPERPCGRPLSEVVPPRTMSWR